MEKSQNPSLEASKAGCVATLVLGSFVPSHDFVSRFLGGGVVPESLGENPEPLPAGISIEVCEPFLQPL